VTDVVDIAEMRHLTFALAIWRHIVFRRWACGRSEPETNPSMTPHSATDTALTRCLKLMKAISACSRSRATWRARWLLSTRKLWHCDCDGVAAHSVQYHFVFR